MGIIVVTGHGVRALPYNHALQHVVLITREKKNNKKLDNTFISEQNELRTSFRVIFSTS